MASPTKCAGCGVMSTRYRHVMIRYCYTCGQMIGYCATCGGTVRAKLEMQAHVTAGHGPKLVRP